MPPGTPGGFTMYRNKKLTGYPIVLAENKYICLMEYDVDVFLSQEPIGVLDVI
jgi:hypothetical protein